MKYHLLDYAVCSMVFQVPIHFMLHFMLQPQEKTSNKDKPRTWAKKKLVGFITRIRCIVDYGWLDLFGQPLEVNGREVAEEDVEEDIPGLSSVFHTRWRYSSEPILL